MEIFLLIILLPKITVWLENKLLFILINDNGVVSLL